MRHRQQRHHAHLRPGLLARGPGARDDLHLDGNCQRIAGGARSLQLRSAALELGALGLGEALQRAHLDVVPAGAHHPPLGLVDAPADALLAHGRDLGLALEPLDDLLDLAPDLPVEAGQIGIELLHARMRRQQSRRQLGDLPLDAHALLDETRHQLRLLHVGERLGAAAGDDLARLAGAGLRLGACRGCLGELARQLAQLLLVEAGLVAPAVEDVGLAAEAGHLRLGLRDLLGELLDLRPELGARILALEHGAQDRGRRGRARLACWRRRRRAWGRSTGIRS